MKLVVAVALQRAIVQGCQDNTKEIQQGIREVQQCEEWRLRVANGPRLGWQATRAVGLRSPFPLSLRHRDNAHTRATPPASCDSFC